MDICAPLLSNCPQRTQVEEVMRFLMFLAGAIALLAPSHSVAAPAQDGLAANMRDIEGHFSRCLEPPEGDAKVVFYFSMKANGAIQGRPRIVWYGAKDEPQQERSALLSEYRRAIEQCTPVHLDAHMASTIPGKVYFLKLTVADHKADVMIRPYGSMGPPLVEQLLPY